MTPRVVIETTTGTLAPKTPDELTLADVLALRRLPANLFQAYVDFPGGPPRPVPSDTRLSALPPDSEVALHCIMNPNFSEFLEILTTRHAAENAITTVEDMALGLEGCEKVVYELDDEGAQAVVRDRVAGFVERYSRAGTVVVGVSGGGDSNALIAGLRAALSANGRALVAYTLVCDPVWPETSAARAATLCQRHGVEHRVMISLAGRALCRQLETDEYCLGYNREDVLAEALFSVINGRSPLAYPVRRFGDLRLLMPVWEVPKLVLDACYPDFSKRNYEQRIGTTPQRGLIYYLAHAIEGVYPGLGLSLMTGMKTIFEHNWPRLREDREYDLHVEGVVDEAQVAAVREFLAAHFRSRVDSG